MILRSEIAQPEHFGPEQNGLSEYRNLILWYFRTFIIVYGKKKKKKNLTLMFIRGQSTCLDQGRQIYVVLITNLFLEFLYMRRILILG